MQRWDGEGIHYTPQSFLSLVVPVAPIPHHPAQSAASQGFAYIVIQRPVLPFYNPKFCPFFLILMYRQYSLLSNTTQPLVQAATVLCLDSCSSCQQLPLPPILPYPQPFYYYLMSVSKPEIWLCHFLIKIFLWFFMVKMSFKPWLGI